MTVVDSLRDVRLRSGRCPEHGLVLVKMAFANNGDVYAECPRVSCHFVARHTVAGHWIEEELTR